MDDQKPLPFPYMSPPGWLPDISPLGEWEEWSAAGAQGWTLKCLPVFLAEIRLIKHRGVYMLDLNGVDMGESASLQAIQDRAEREIIARVRKMLPAYRVIHGRVMQRQGPG